MKTTKLFLLTGFAILVLSCSKDDDTFMPEKPQVEEETTTPEEEEQVVLTAENTPGYMVDPAATAETMALFYNLKKLSKEKVIIGQQDAFHFFYNDNVGDSDIKKTTGSDPGLLGSDFSFITDDENDGTPENWFYQQELQITSDAVEAYNKGMVNIFSWHFREPFEGDHFYTSEMTEEQKANAFKSILPGGENHEYYKEKLQKIASVAQNMTGNDGKLTPIIFRPFHEFDGNWFWWGKAYCTSEEFITGWQFTVEYLRDELGVHNLLYAFSPDNHFNDENVYLERYPGDEYVDILGMDNYGDLSGTAEGYPIANDKLKIISDLAKEKVKIAALTETGRFVSAENPPLTNYYTQLLDVITNDVEIGFMMFWTNNQDSYTTPPPETADADDFRAFANDEATLLQEGLPNIYSIND